MFRRTQNRLTLFYSGMFITFLLLFTVIVYSVFYMIITAEQKQELQTLTDQEFALVQNLMKNNSGDPNHQFDIQNVVQAGEGQFFCYVMAPDGRLLAGNEQIASLRPDLLQKVRGWIPQEDEVRAETLKLPHDRRIHLLMAGRALYEQDRLIGLMYTAKDITFYRYIMGMLLTVLIVLSFIFLIIASIAGSIMSRRAMVPIVRSYARQQEFVADASHELRTPLSVLYSSLEVVEAEEQEQLSPFSRQVLFEMKDELKRMIKLVNDLLVLARSDSEGLDLLYESFDLVAVVQKLIASIQPLASSRQIRLQIDAPESLRVSADPERIRQLLFILLDNAIKYTPEGGEVTVSVRESIRQKKKGVYLQVRDTGIGIPPEHQPRIFDRFYRGDADRSRQTGGTGLGLSIARSIAEAHQGSIEVSSREGEGSTFTAWIPAGGRKE
jgi:signal transduction histidine kinase